MTKPDMDDETYIKKTEDFTYPTWIDKKDLIRVYCFSCGDYLTTVKRKTKEEVSFFYCEQCAKVVEDDSEIKRAKLITDKQRKDEYFDTQDPRAV